MAEYKNRYDVTLLVNGLPLVQIELKAQRLGNEGSLQPNQPLSTALIWILILACFSMFKYSLSATVSTPSITPTTESNLSSKPSSGPIRNNEAVDQYSERFYKRLLRALSYLKDDMQVHCS